MKCRKALPGILSKYIILSSTIDPHQCQQILYVYLTHVYKKDTKKMLDLTGSPRYVRMYDLLHWVVTPYFLIKYVHVGFYDYEVSFDTNPDLVQLMHYTLWHPI